MRYVTIPKTDIRVSAVCMGTVAYGSTISETDSFAQLDRFVEQGGVTSWIRQEFMPTGFPTRSAVPAKRLWESG